VTLLSVRNLEVRYGAVAALRDVSLAVGEGEIVTLIGSNGAGKSTLLRAISGLHKPSSGDILWNGSTALQKLPAHAIVSQGISHVPEGRQVFANLTVHENLLLGAYQRKDKREIVESLERVNALFPILRERREQAAATLSGGEQQMLAIGRALMAKPKLMLLDEPSLGLAPLVVQLIFRVILEVNRSGTTILLVEQNAHMALRVAHRGYVLQAGQLVLSGTGKELLDSPEVKAAYLGE
jgi:branched-chain amino acid transport system ATP-binding protein